MTALTAEWCVRIVAFASSKRVIGGDRAGMVYRALWKDRQNAGGSG
jgi:hypothetical protein